MRGDLIEVLKPMLLLLFPSLDKEGDICAQAGGLLPEGSATMRHLSEVMATSGAGHALALVKSHYPRVDLEAVAEGYAVDCSDDDI
uniref:Uncharacterized protein n=1 Tax=Oryza punctata TaxID=4537 RepID=A0A0E0LB52_ORYPU